MKKIHVAREAPDNFPVVPLLSRGIQQGEVFFCGGGGEGDFWDNFFFSVSSLVKQFLWLHFHWTCKKLLRAFVFFNQKLE